MFIEIEIFIHQIGSKKTDQETEQTQPCTIRITRKLKTDYKTKSTKQTTKLNHEAQQHSYSSFIALFAIKTHLCKKKLRCMVFDL